MEKIRIAQIGIGHDHADDVFFAIRDMKQYFEVVGYALPPQEENSESFRARADRTFVGFPQLTVEQILEDPTIDAVTVETEELNLTKYALLAARHGKHIHMDKPGGIELADFEALIAAVREKRLTFHLGYMYRYNPCVEALLEKIDRGELGEIFSVEAHMSCRHKATKREWLGRFPGGMMFFLGCHLVDLIYRIQGKPKRVIPLNKATGADGVTAQDFGMAILEYENGVSFAKSTAEDVGGFDRRQLVVSGTLGTVRLMPLEMPWDENDRLNLYTNVTEYTGLDWFNRGTTTKSAPYDRYSNMIEDFALITLGKRENRYSYDYELEAYKLVLQCCGL